jgi:hypothetical protein
MTGWNDHLDPEAADLVEVATGRGAERRAELSEQQRG